MGITFYLIVFCFKANEKEIELEEVNKTNNDIMKGIGVLFNQFGCSKDPLIELLGKKSKVCFEATVHEIGLFGSS